MSVYTILRLIPEISRTPEATHSTLLGGSAHRPKDMTVNKSEGNAEG